MGLESLLPELIFHLCLFLCEADIVSLSHTCSRLFHLLNDDVVWKRFVTEDVRSLETTKQNLEPPFHPDLSFCENRQHLQRKNRVISNWRRGRCLNLSERFRKRYRFLKTAEHYKENYLLVRLDEGYRPDHHHMFWNIGGIPKVHADKRFHEYFYRIGDRFVHHEEDCCRVNVYQINIEKESFPLLYSFFIVEDEICDDNPRKRKRHECVRPLWSDWSHSSGGNYLVFNEAPSGFTNPTFHIWDIVRSRKVGVFRSPLTCRKVTVYAFVDNTLIFLALTGENDVSDITFFKFDVTTKRFSDAVFTVENYSDFSLEFFKDYCIMMKGQFCVSNGEHFVKCEIYDFNTSSKITERCFLNADYECQGGQHLYILAVYKDRIPIVDGKLIILGLDSFLVVDLLTLETLSVVPHQSNVLRIIGKTSVFGLVFLVTVGNDGTLTVWDVEKQRAIPTPHERFSQNTLRILKSGWWEYCKFQESGPLTKYTVIDEYMNITVTHLW